MNGNQVVAQLSASVLSGDEERGVRREGDKSDARIPQVMGGKGNALLTEDDESPADETPSDLDIDFFPSTLQLSVYDKRKPSSATAHVFGQVSSYRGTIYGSSTNDEDDDEDKGYTRKRRRIAGLPLLEKYVPFPSILPPPNIHPLFFSIYPLTNQIF